LSRPLCVPSAAVVLIDAGRSNRKLGQGVPFPAYKTPCERWTFADSLRKLSATSAHLACLRRRKPMRFTAGTVAGVVLLSLLAANCGDDSNNSSGGKGGSAMQGGEGGTSPGTGGSSAGKGGSAPVNGGEPSTGAVGGEGGSGTPQPACDAANPCPDNAECIDDVCKLVDGETCAAAADCINNCVDDVCSPLLPDGAGCTGDAQCAHTCIDGMCAPISGVAGPCDDGAGAGGAGGAGPVAPGGGGEGGGPGATSDCSDPLVCVDSKCLTPDGEACTDNIDCINVCVANVCGPVAGLNGPCDDGADCSEGMVCNPGTDTCKLDLLSTCTANAQCQTNKCLCANATCSVRNCKTDDSNCLCKYSTTNSCSAASPDLNSQVQDPNGCSAPNFCHESLCVPQANGTCSQSCDADCAGLPATLVDDCTAGRQPVASCTVNKTCMASCSCTLQ